jgi:hypothetical protein
LLTAIAVQFLLDGLEEALAGMMRAWLAQSVAK